jgi:hypothetical protein
MGREFGSATFLTYDPSNVLTLDGSTLNLGPTSASTVTIGRAGGTTVLDAGTGKAYFPESPTWPGEKSFTIESSEDAFSFIQINQTNTNEKNVGFYAQNTNGAQTGEVTLNLSGGGAGIGEFRISPANASNFSVNVNGAGAAVASAGDLTFDASLIQLQIGSANRLRFDGSDIIVQDGTIFTTEGSGNINLPNSGVTRFKIQGASVGATVTAANLTALTNGSNADGYHTHAMSNSFATTTVSSNTTLDGTHYTVRCNAAGAGFTITLPAAAGCTGRLYNIKKVDASSNTIIIDANSSETIDGDLGVNLESQYDCLTIQSNGTGWDIL